MWGPGAVAENVEEYGSDVADSVVVDFDVVAGDLRGADLEFLWAAGDVAVVEDRHANPACLASKAAASFQERRLLANPADWDWSQAAYHFAAFAVGDASWDSAAGLVVEPVVGPVVGRVEPAAVA